MRRAGIQRLLEAAAKRRNGARWALALVDMIGPPFGDVGPERMIAFEALGVRWTIHGRNNRPTSVAVEDFASSLQILLVELVSHDPVIVPQDVDVEVHTYGRGEKPDQMYMTRLAKDKRLWLVLMPAEPQAEEPAAQRQHLLILMVQVLLGNSLLDQEPFMTMIEKAASAGLLHKLEVGRPYHELATLRSGDVGPLAGNSFRPLDAGSRFPRSLTPYLDAPTGPGPGYSIEGVSRR